MLNLLNLNKKGSAEWPDPLRPSPLLQPAMQLRKSAELGIKKGEWHEY
jgi:hypothetical protein